MLRNETWLQNLTTFICYASWIYGRSIKGFYAHAKTKCLEESIIVFKFVDNLTLLFWIWSLVSKSLMLD
jgi:hypothetical protein